MQKFYDLNFYYRSELGKNVNTDEAAALGKNMNIMDLLNSSSYLPLHILQTYLVR